MSTRVNSRFPGKILSAALVAPLFFSVAAADRPSPVGVRDLPVPADTPLVGYGKGRLVMPVVTQDGRMFGVLADNDGVQRFQLEALLTGCMPGMPFSVDAYTFGGVYGKVRKFVDADPKVGSHSFLYDIEGTWVLDGRTRGSFSAVAYQVLDSGRRFVAGKMYGEFDFGPAGSLAFTAPVDDAAIGSKWRKSPFGDARRFADPYGDAKSAPSKDGGKVAVGDVRRARAADALGDSKSVPRKDGGKVVVDDARSKHVTHPFGDSKSVPRKGAGKSPFDDVATAPTEPTLGSFMLRYVFVR